MVRVLVVDDSAFVRRSLVGILEKDKDIEVVGQARNGQEAIDMVKELDPDVVTLDVEMPRMDGITALGHIMAENPVPVIMVSSLTSDGAEVTLKALEMGASDFIPKLSSGSLPDIARLEAELSGKIKTLARRKSFIRLMHNKRKAEGGSAATTAGLAARRPGGGLAPFSRSPGGASQTATLELKPGRRAFDAVCIGVSTGGPPAVQKVLSALPANFPAPILIAQHMPASFTGPFARRLDTQCAISVKEAEPIERLKPGVAYVCPGGKHLQIENRKGTLTGVVSEEPLDALYKPSANVLMESLGVALGRRGLGITLTGMGNDGFEGTKVLKEKGGRALAQSEATCVVYGMPKAIVDANLADEVVDLDDMATAIVKNMTSG